MPRDLSIHSRLELLRREARRWHYAMAAGDRQAVARFRSACPTHSGAPGLRAVQHALAREHGFASWGEMKQELEDRARTAAERVRLFLEKSVHRYGVAPSTQQWGDYEGDGPGRGEQAARLLARHPEIASASIHTAVAAHNPETVRALLASRPELCHDRSPFDGWTPLQRLGHTRLPLPALTAHAVQIATLLLEAGADPNAAGPAEGWSAASAGFPALVGVIGGGEHRQSEHPQAVELARLLIAHGADPFVPQALYNTSLGPDSTFWLDFLWEHSVRAGETHRWTGPSPQELGGAEIPSALAYLLGNAVPNHLERTRWLLAHGADARGINFYSRMPVIKHAVLAGRADMVALLVEHGATPPQLSAEEELLAAVGSGDLLQARELAQAHPEFLRSHAPMFVAIRRQRPDIAALLLDLGMSPDVADEQGMTALHLTAHCGTPDIARLLIARGAEVDACERRYGGTPLTHATYHGRDEMVAVLVPVSRNLRGLCFAGAMHRLSELLREDPAGVNREDRPGEPALFCLPADDEKAAEVAELLLSFGADPSLRNPLGQTPADAARHRGLDGAAGLLEEAAARAGGRVS